MCYHFHLSPKLLHTLTACGQPRDIGGGEGVDNLAASDNSLSRARRSGIRLPSKAIRPVAVLRGWQFGSNTSCDNFSTANVRE